MADTTPPTRTLDLYLSGAVFLDVVLADLGSGPCAGTEAWARRMAVAPGGAANMAIAAARLGLRVALASDLGADAAGAAVRQVLADEGVDLTRTLTHVGRTTPITVSLAYDSDRAMVTYQPDRSTPSTQAPYGAARAVFVDARDGVPERIRVEREETGLFVFADIGWDPSGSYAAGTVDGLRGVDVFFPNEREAVALTGTASAEAAFRVLARIVPCPVITLGSRGVMIPDKHGRPTLVPGVEVDAIDATGAGDVFASAFAAATLWQWPLVECARLAVLCSALSVRELSGSLSAPGWSDILMWLEGDLDPVWHFIHEFAESMPARPQRRATATLAV